MLEMSSHKYTTAATAFTTVDLIVAKLVHVDTARYRDRCSRMYIWLVISSLQSGKSGDFEVHVFSSIPMRIGDTL